MVYKSLTTPAAEGGTVTTSGGYRIHTFTLSGTLTVNKPMNVEVLVVAGGGSGGRSYRYDYAGGGGGGAGGLVYNSAFAVTPQLYAITVGAGGATQTVASSRGFNGSDSSFGTITAIGGGGGGSGSPGISSGNNGGSGGGATFDTSTNGSGSAGQGIVGQGYNGGIVTTNDAGAGGGGASAVGSNGATSGGNGGNGLSSSISGSTIWYAGGGGGGNYYTGSAGTGGIGGGGAGGTSGSSGTAGADNTGGGGGGCGTFGTLGNGGAGGSGIVIIRYLLSEDLAPANITATNMTTTASESPCRVGICTITASVTWTNNGGSTGSFTPSITASSGTVTPVYPSEQLAAGAPVTHSFTVSSMTTGTCSICPNPN